MFPALSQPDVFLLSSERVGDMRNGFSAFRFSAFAAELLHLRFFPMPKT
jgi:hypothetical protein